MLLQADVYQVMLRLQRLRSRVEDLMNGPRAERLGADDADVLLDSLQAIAASARESGMAAYTSLCLSVCERIEQWRRRGNLPRPVLASVLVWIDMSHRYLQRPAGTSLASAPAADSSDPQLESEPRKSEFDRILQLLMHPALASRSAK